MQLVIPANLRKNLELFVDTFLIGAAKFFTYLLAFQWTGSEWSPLWPLLEAFVYTQVLDVSWMCSGERLSCSESLFINNICRDLHSRHSPPGVLADGAGCGSPRRSGLHSPNVTLSSRLHKNSELLANDHLPFGCLPGIASTN